MVTIGVIMLIGSLVVVGVSSFIRFQGKHALSWLLLLVAAMLAISGSLLTHADDSWGLQYVCSANGNEVYHLTTDNETWWTLTPQQGSSSVTTNRSGYYTFARGGVYVWVGLSPIGLADTEDKPCGAEQVQPYVDPMNECLGFYAPVTEFIVDGVTYSAGTDGWISFLVPVDAVWTWVVTVDGWTGSYQQTETEECHYVG